ncbi:hypothetical protein [Acinetobacter cumulans]|uniref:hypothetical protein n=1 Tax=Acinetobacter cumulans TaxID=2136182 RepID=UPI001443AA95|nr:hypothetical protein [Acinetobacter cumulans]
MYFTHDGHTIEIFSDNIDELARAQKFQLINVVGVSSKFIKFVFEAELDGDSIEIEAIYGQNNYLDDVRPTDKYDEDLFYENFSHKDFEKVIIK